MRPVLRCADLLCVLLLLTCLAHTRTLLAPCAAGCNYKYLDPTVNKGWDVAALPDAVHDYKGSCGRCYEIGCAPMHLKDGYGTGLDRSHVCFDTTKTVVVMITDSCKQAAPGCWWLACTPALVLALITCSNLLEALRCRL